jgi:hypothetical protein
MDLNKRIGIELNEARQKYGPFNSTHEAYAVLKEEFEEFWDLVKLRPGKHKTQAMVNELIQVAAITQRIIEELENDEIKWV